MRSSVAVATILLLAAPSGILSSEEQTTRITTECEPGQHFKRGCNHCVCDDQGNAAFCTLGLCTSEERTTRITTECEPGQHFKRGCNDCVCDDQGNAAFCTLGLCKSDAEVGLRYGGKMACTPGSIFQMDCNSCRCNDKGDRALCTQRRCYDVCRPGTLRFKNCNICLCHPVDWKCTNFTCPEKEKENFCPNPGVDGGRGGPCPPEGRRKRDVREATTIKTYVCLGKNLQRKKNCSPDTPPVDPPPRKKQPKPPVVCLTRTPFKKNCNTCRCRIDGGKYPCTSDHCDNARKSRAQGAIDRLVETNKLQSEDSSARELPIAHRPYSTLDPGEGANRRTPGETVARSLVVLPAADAAPVAQRPPPEKNCPDSCTLDVAMVTASCRGGTRMKNFINTCIMELHNCRHGDDCSLISTGQQEVL